jgi:hypothetical protein
MSGSVIFHCKNIPTDYFVGIACFFKVATAAYCLIMIDKSANQSKHFHCKNGRSKVGTFAGKIHELLVQLVLKIAGTTFMRPEHPQSFHVYSQDKHITDRLSRNVLQVDLIFLILKHRTNFNNPPVSTTFSALSKRCLRISGCGQGFEANGWL